MLQWGRHFFKINLILALSCPYGLYFNFSFLLPNSFTCVLMHWLTCWSDSTYTCMHKCTCTRARANGCGCVYMWVRERTTKRCSFKQVRFSFRFNLRGLPCVRAALPASINCSRLSSQGLYTLPQNTFESILAAWWDSFNRKYMFRSTKPESV